MNDFRLLVAIPSLNNPANYGRFSVCLLSPGVSYPPVSTVVYLPSLTSLTIIFILHPPLRRDRMDDGWLHDVAAPGHRIPPPPHPPPPPTSRQRVVHHHHNHHRRRTTTSTHRTTTTTTTTLRRSRRRRDGDRMPRRAVRSPGSPGDGPSCWYSPRLRRMTEEANDADHRRPRR